MSLPENVVVIENDVVVENVEDRVARIRFEMDGDMDVEIEERVGSNGRENVMERVRFFGRETDKVLLLLSVVDCVNVLNAIR